ncbi:MAG: metallophosphatase [Nonlabens sp.]
MKKHLFYKHIYYFAFLLVVISSLSATAQNEESEISKTLYFSGNLGNTDAAEASSILSAIVKASQKDQNAVFVSLGNSTNKSGYPADQSERQSAQEFLRKRYLEPLSDFNGQVIYIPGKNEWSGKGHEAIDDLESFLQDNSDGKFWPNDGCPIERETLSDQVELVMVDSQWFFEDWDDHPYINNKCDIKTREDFFLQFKDELKDEQNKTIVVALYHSVLSESRRGLFELMGGFTNESFWSNQMQSYIGRLESLALQFEDVIFVSGNETNLQFLSDDGIPQIITGSGKNIRGVKEVDSNEFAAEKTGFSKLIVFKDGSSKLELFEVQGSDTNLLYSTTIKSKTKYNQSIDYNLDQYGEDESASIYTEEETDKSGFYKWFWGNHYRTIYGKEITAPVLKLDELPHNVRAITSGGGNQSRSLRLIDDNENEFTVRELRKSALRFAQSFVKDHYVHNYLDDTVAEDVIQDYYTTAHPYAQFVVGDLLDAINIYHANKQIVYLPKQERLGRFNESYGDKLYMFEEHVGDENINLGIFGEADDIISTADLFLELRDDKDAQVDESKYIRARLFDMLIGDWDRHQDQWRWIENEQADGTVLYSPIPRDRDQAFPRYDGIFPALLKLGAPLARNMQTYQPFIPNVKTFNNAAYYLDKSFINEAGWEEWQKQTEFIQEQLTDEVIDNAFSNLLEDTQDETTEKIKSILKQRRSNLDVIAKDYFDYFKKHEVIIATTKDNIINVERRENGITKITIFQKDKIIHENTYDKELTKEIWLYGLDGDDTFNVTGDGSDYIKIKFFGGEENDIYNIENRRRIKVYDYASKKNTFNDPVSKSLTDSYDLNNYDPKKRKYSTNVLLPAVGFDPDAGFQVALRNTYTTFGLLNNPFETKHQVTARYYGATQGFEFSYDGAFAHVFHNWNLGLNARYTSDSFAINYFGEGNDTSYDNDDVGLDFNRVSIQQFHFEPSLRYKKSENITAYISGRLESNEVLEDNNGFIRSTFNPENDIFESQVYAGGEVGLLFNNKANLLSLPRRGMEFGLMAGYKRNIDSDFNNEFSYVRPTASFILPLAGKGIATLATKAQAHFIIGDQYEFYHGATVGGNRSLRGYRNERFNGKTAFFSSTDLRVGIAKFRTGFAPLRLGVSGGFDTGRVWLPEQDSDQWHSNVGGSIFLTGYQALTANIGYYVSDQDSRIIFTAGFTF